jgi:Flp pilus assembly protein TadG
MRVAARRERGGSLPETALVMSVVLLLLVGIMDFGRAMYTYAFVAQLAREGARWTMVRGDQCTLLDHCSAASSDVQTYVRGLSEGATTASSITATATWQNVDCPSGSSGKDPGCAVTVTVSYPYHFLAAFMPAVINMSSTSQMVISQ